MTARPRFLADQNLDDAIVLGLARLEPAIVFDRLRELGFDRSADDEVLAFASEQQYIIVTHDVNSMIAAAKARLKRAQPMSGLLLVKQRAAIRPIIESLLFVWSESDADDWQGHIQYLPL